jgi:hypothetical protein
MTGPPLVNLIRELRNAVPPEIHPSARHIVHEYLAEAWESDWQHGLRLIRMAVEKIADELEWEATKRDGILHKRQEMQAEARRPARQPSASRPGRGRPENRSRYRHGSGPVSVLIRH